MSSGRLYRAGRRILDTAAEDPGRIALIIDGESYSYSELVAAAAGIAAAFPDVAADDPQAITAVMAQRHISSYAGILAARLSGHAYVPLNVKHPCQRNARILQSSGARRVVCGERASDKLQAILESAGIAADQVPIIGCGDTKAAYRLEGNGRFAEPRRPCSRDDLAYILFTSGSTGNPKGVPIRNRELEAFLAAAGGIVAVQPDDRFSQTFDLTFDLSVHDLFLCWENGATLVVPSETQLRMPSAYIREHRVSCWFSVPSLAYQVRLQEDLNPGAFPDLRLSLFCGEALPTLLAREWALAAPNSRVENWYGPTEATIACSHYILGDQSIEDDTVPIGRPFPGMELLIQDEELLLAGEQVASGYLNDAEKTSASFITLDDGKRAYRTGDRAVQDPDGNFHFLGRLDNQVKVRGYRIELGEIEAALRRASGGLNAVAMAWPGDGQIATTIIAALETETADTSAILQGARSVLPEYMLPSMIFCVPEFPKNASGKMDRKALAGSLGDRAHGADEFDLSDLPAEGKILMNAILTHAPLLDPAQVLAASSLFDAGMDSLAFVSVTTEVEHSLGLSLDQDTVIVLSEMSFDEIVREARGETHLLATVRDAGENLTMLDRLRRFLGIPRIIRKPRANRALQFIQRLPDYLAEHGAPDILAVGSSGTFRAFCPAEFAPAVALNAGFPAINAAGMERMCRYIREQFEKAGARVPLVIYEFDPMHLCTTPPSGDINLSEEFFNGNVLPLTQTNPEFEWRVETLGAWNAPGEERQKDRKPNWVRERDRVIASVYLGEVEFDARAVDHWFAGAAALQAISDRVVCFIHPADKAMTDEIRGSCGSDTLVAFTDEITGKLGIPVLPWESFDLEPDDFLDINHMNARGGREKLSRQLAAMVRAAD